MEVYLFKGETAMPAPSIADDDVGLLTGQSPFSVTNFIAPDTSSYVQSQRDAAFKVICLSF